MFHLCCICDIVPFVSTPYISRVNVSDVQTGDAFGALVQPSALSMLAAAPEASRANSGVFKSILINCNASRLLSYLSSRIRWHIRVDLLRGAWDDGFTLA